MERKKIQHQQSKKKKKKYKFKKINLKKLNYYVLYIQLNLINYILAKDYV